MKHDAPTRRLALRLLRRLDLTLADIVATTGVTRRTLQTWAREDGIPPRSRGTRPSIFTAKTRALAVKLYLRGVKMRTIEATTGAGCHEIRKWVKAAGHPLRATHTNGRIDTAQAAALAAEHGPAEAARRLGCVTGTVLYHQEKARRLRIRAELLAEEKADATANP